jgi:nucleoside-diphosphate-sugar epimerase
MGMWFQEAINAKKEGRNMVVPGSPGGRLAMIHTDDLARLFLGVIERAPLCKGLIFDASNDSSESVTDLLTKITEVVGAKGFEYKEPANGALRKRCDMDANEVAD